MVTLRPMTQAEFDVRVPALRREYVQDEIRSGRSDGSHVDELFARLLPDGLGTEGQLMFTGLAGGEVVGFVWLALPTPERQQAWVYELHVDPGRRRQGHGRALMLAAEEELRARGVTRLGLNVFGHNPGAQTLYESLGFETTSRQMSKPL